MMVVQHFSRNFAFGGRVFAVTGIVNADCISGSESSDGVGFARQAGVDHLGHKAAPLDMAGDI